MWLMRTTARLWRNEGFKNNVRKEVVVVVVVIVEDIGGGDERRKESGVEGREGAGGDTLRLN